MRLAAFLLFAVFGLTSGGLFWLQQFRLSGHHLMMEHKLKDVHELVTLRMSASDFQQALVEEDELKLEGRWFDISSVEASEGGLLVTGTYDNEEEALRIFASCLLPSHESPVTPLVVHSLPLFYENAESPVVPGISFFSEIFPKQSGLYNAGFTRMALKPPASC